MIGLVHEAARLCELAKSRLRQVAGFGTGRGRRKRRGARPLVFAGHAVKLLVGIDQPVRLAAGRAESSSRVGNPPEPTTTPSLIVLPPVMSVAVIVEAVTTTSNAAYRAVQSKDARFDGRSVVAVLTTSVVYRRPSCPRPGPIPFARNVRFRRHHAVPSSGRDGPANVPPRRPPGSPEWNVRSDVVARAMRLIADGTVDRDGAAASRPSSVTPFASWSGRYAPWSAPVRSRWPAPNACRPPGC